MAEGGGIEPLPHRYDGFRDRLPTFSRTLREGLKRGQNSAREATRATHAYNLVQTRVAVKTVAKSNSA